MKKLFNFLAASMIILTFSACSVGTQYYSSEALYPSRKDAREVIERADIVVVGRVSNISFQVLDQTTALMPTEESDPMDRRLCTIYDIEVATLYKGEIQKPLQIRVDGGLKGYRVREQLGLMNKMEAWPSDGILVQSQMPKIEEGNSYLFALVQFETGIPTNMNPDQSIFNLRNPFTKKASGNHETDESYYAKTTDENGRPLMSARDVISAFGQEKWDEFWVQWQKDNPKWETWIDKDAVQSALK